MKRRELERRLRSAGCTLLREGAAHSIWENPKTGKTAPVPRHNEVKELTAQRILRQLEVE